MIKDYLTPEEVLTFTSKEYNFLAMDADGKWWFYKNLPYLSEPQLQYSPPPDFWEHGILNHPDDIAYCFVNIKYEGDWKDSLICRDDLENSQRKETQTEIKSKKIPFKWRTIEYSSDSTYEFFTQRAKVYNGWLVRDLVLGSDRKRYLTTSIIFLNDPNYEWEIE